MKRKKQGTTNEKIVILSKDANEIIGIKKMNSYESDEIIARDIEQLKKLYFTYQFSEHFIYASMREANFASIINLVEAEVMTYDEAMQVIFV